MVQYKLQWRGEISFAYSYAVPSFSHQLRRPPRCFSLVLFPSPFFFSSWTLSEHLDHCFSRWSKGTVHQVNAIVSFTSISLRVFRKFGICIMLPLVPWISSFSFVSFYLHPLYAPLPDICGARSVARRIIVIWDSAGFSTSMLPERTSCRFTRMQIRWTGDLGFVSRVLAQPSFFKTARFLRSISCS